MVSATPTIAATTLAPTFVCPSCRGSLEPCEEGVRCGGCQTVYPVIDGITCFCQGDEFYEGKWVDSDLSAGSLRNLLVKKERFFVNMLRGKRGSVLDLGCAGGWRFYTTVGPVTGVDLSVSSLRRAKGMYSAVARAELRALPFRDGSFDFVVSSDLIGHIAEEDKDIVLGEVRRVLKSGGWTLHYVEAEGRDPLMRFARRYPELYDRYVVQPDGHVGMESPEDTFRRFRRLGFKPVRELAAYRGLTYVGRVVQYFDNEYSRLSRPIGALVGVCKALRSNRALETGANVIMSCLIEGGDRVLPHDWAGGVLVCYEKP